MDDLYIAPRNMAMIKTKCFFCIDKGECISLAYGCYVNYNIGWVCCNNCKDKLNRCMKMYVEKMRMYSTYIFDIDHSTPIKFKRSDGRDYLGCINYENVDNISKYSDYYVSLKFIDNGFMMTKSILLKDFIDQNRDIINKPNYELLLKEAQEVGINLKAYQNFIDDIKKIESNSKP